MWMNDEMLGLLIWTIRYRTTIKTNCKYLVRRGCHYTRNYTAPWLIITGMARIISNTKLLYQVLKYELFTAFLWPSFHSLMSAPAPGCFPSSQDYNDIFHIYTFRSNNRSVLSLIRLTTFTQGFVLLSSMLSPLSFKTPTDQPLHDQNGKWWRSWPFPPVKLDEHPLLLRIKWTGINLKLLSLILIYAALYGT